MKKIITISLVLITAALSLTACGGNDKNDIKGIERPETAATNDEADFSAPHDAVEKSANVNGLRFNMTLHEFTTKYNETKALRNESDIIFFGNWQKNGEVQKDDNGTDVQYYYYDDKDLSFTAAVEVNTEKLLNIGCGTTMSRFTGMTDEKNNSDTILQKAALMARVACGFPEESESVLQDIFFQTATGTEDTLWYNGYVFHLSTKSDHEDSKNNIMLFRVFPVTDSLKKEWNLKEY